jgi:hypothetical protein
MFRACWVYAGLSNRSTRALFVGMEATISKPTLAVCLQSEQPVMSLNDKSFRFSRT